MDPIKDTAIHSVALAVIAAVIAATPISMRQFASLLPGTLSTEQESDVEAGSLVFDPSTETFKGTISSTLSEDTPELDVSIPVLLTGNYTLVDNTVQFVFASPNEISGEGIKKVWFVTVKEAFHVVSIFISDTEVRFDTDNDVVGSVTIIHG